MVLRDARTMVHGEHKYCLLRMLLFHVSGVIRIIAGNILSLKIVLYIAYFHE